MPSHFEVLHYTGADDDRGGIVSIVRSLAAAGRFDCVLGLNPGAMQERAPFLPVVELPRLAGERISAANFWRARETAEAVRDWLAESPARVFHGHSRAGLLVALWLRWRGERRVIVSVHCYGRHRWFYRWAADRLGDALYWLSPAMKRHYGLAGADWSRCRPGCVATGAPPAPLRQPDASPVLRLGGAGALVAWKNWDLLLEALRLLPVESQRRIRFRHIGTDDGTAASRAYGAKLRAASAALAADVAWLGQQPSSTTLLGEIDVLVVASRNEPFSVAMLEALYAGVPVLAADSGGTEDAVEPGVSGWLFRSGDPGDLARRLGALLAGEPLRGAGAVAPGIERFAASAAAADWERIYQAVVRTETR